MNKKLVLIPCLITIMSGTLLSASASAESGWVLWEKNERINMGMRQGISWEIIDANPDYNQCLQTRMKIWQHEKNQAIEKKKEQGEISEIKEVPSLQLIIIFNKQSSIWKTFYCLPGTLDPRERK